MPYLTVNGVRLHYLAQGTGPAVVLLHGLGSCADDWALQFAALAGHYTLVAPDLRGHGRSDKPPGPYTISQMADDVAGVMEELGIETAHVVGLSLGGLVAQALMVGHPGQVHSLVLVNTFARLRPWGARSWWHLLSRGLALLTGGLEAQSEVVARELFPHPGQEGLRRMAVQRLSANDPAAYRATMRGVLRFDGRRHLARFHVPTLVVAGAEDTAVGLAAKRELAAQIPGSRLEVVPNSGHATPVDQPERFNGLVLRFLEEMDG